MPQKQFGDLLSTSQPCLGCKRDLKGEPTYTQPNLPVPLVRCPQCQFCQPVGDIKQAAEQSFPEIWHGTDYPGLVLRLALLVLVLMIIVALIVLIIKIF